MTWSSKSCTPCTVSIKAWSSCATGVTTFTNAGTFDRKSGKVAYAKAAERTADDAMDVQPAAPARCLICLFHTVHNILWDDGLTRQLTSVLASALHMWLRHAETAAGSAGSDMSMTASRWRRWISLRGAAACQRDLRRRAQQRAAGRSNTSTRLPRRSSSTTPRCVPVWTARPALGLRSALQGMSASLTACSM